jgi:hypothetical protein
MKLHLSKTPHSFFTMLCALIASSTLLLACANCQWTTWIGDEYAYCDVSPGYGHCEYVYDSIDCETNWLEQTLTCYEWFEAENRYVYTGTTQGWGNGCYTTDGCDPTT